MERSFYGTGSTKNLDLLCDVLFPDTTNKKTNVNHKSSCINFNNLTSNCCCENLYNKKSENENNIFNHSILSHTYSPNSSHVKKSMKYINQDFNGIAVPITSYKRKTENQNFLHKTSSIQPVHHKQILSSVFKPIKTTCLNGLDGKEIKSVFMRAVRFGLKNNEKVSIRYLCVYVLLLNDCGMQLKRIYEDVLKLCPNIRKEINWKGRIRYSLSLYAQFEKAGQVNGTGSAIWSFRLQ